MAKKRLTIGARVRHKKNGASDGVIRSSLGRGKWMIKWSDKEAEEEVNSWSLVIFEEVEEESSSSSSDEESSSSSSDEEASQKEDASSGESEDEHARKSTISIQTLIDWTGIKLRYFSLFSPSFFIYHNLILSVQGH